MFVEYSNQLWPNYLNFTIWIFFMFSLEKELVYELWKLFVYELWNELFEQLMQGDNNVWKYWRHLNNLLVQNLCLKKLLFQLNNSVKDNKNKQNLFALIARKVFEVVQLGFLVIGHTYEDIDKSFGYLSKNLTKQNNYVGRLDEIFYGNS